MGAMKPAQNTIKTQNLRLRTLDITPYMGNTHFDLNVYALNLEANFSVGKKQNHFIQVKVPYYYVQGNLATKQGIGDISLSYSKPLFKNELIEVNGTLGAKIATGNSNLLAENGKPLPMYYQISLGTYDLVGGVSLIYKDWLFATGFQIPLFNNPNQNQFKWGSWADTQHANYVRQYPIALDLKRMPDMMLRIEKSFKLARFAWHTGLLNILHLAEDEITSPQTNLRVRATGSAGLIVNYLNTFEYRLSIEKGFRFVWAYKLRTNDITPSGLSREYVLSLGYFQSF
jgi:hypothetical protein